MGRIRVLEDRLIDRIAAGEVVERPASVVKELVENSIDAGARSIEIGIESGGKRTIRVGDDGEGMDRDDALLAVERHATSKIHRFDELQRIGTLGFRGEALASIAAVSRFLLRTASVEGVGTEVAVRGGRIQSVREIGAPRGTSIEVGSLFFNVPARRKFLRADATELSHVTRLVSQLAVAHPRVRFRLEHEGRQLLDAPATSERLDRLVQIHGRDLARKLLRYRSERNGVVVEGYACRPVEALPRRDGQHFFVNGRVVHDRVIAHAVADAYRNTVPRGRHPAIVVCLEIDPAGVDVNVHPRKSEVRFVRSSEVHDLVRDAIASVLGQGRAVPSLADVRPGARGIAAETRRRFELREPAPAVPEVATDPPAPAEDAAASFAARAPEPLPYAATPRHARALAQYDESFIVASDGEGLLLVDQHAAHERVLFERYLADANARRVRVQRLLIPKVVELAAHERVLLESETEEFRRLGFEVEPFGDAAVRIDGVPAIASEAEPERLFREVLGEAARMRSPVTGVAELRRRLVTTAACQAAIKINHRLTVDGMQCLLDDLFRTRNPTTCPHGRPALYHLSRAEIERGFRRR